MSLQNQNQNQTQWFVKCWFLVSNEGQLQIMANLHAERTNVETVEWLTLDLID